MSKAATMKPSRGIGLGGGWLSMAPQTENTPYKPQPVAIVDEQKDSTRPSTSISSSDQNSPVLPPHRSKHGGLQPQPSSSSSSHAINSETFQDIQEPESSKIQSAGPSALPRRLIPRTNARFSVGDSTSQPATPASPAPSSPPISPGSQDQSPDAFDVRSSFAPMQWSKMTNESNFQAPSSSRRVSQAEVEGRSGNRLQQGLRTGMVAKNKADVIIGDHEEDSDGERVEYAGRKWRGKTANAIEQEMEALGDRTVMSYAPDAVYLASRLEGLRRNLEAGGDRFRRWAWEDYDETASHDDGDGDHQMEGTDVVIAKAAKRLSQELESPSVIALRQASAHVSQHASPARSALLSSTVLSPVQEIPTNPLSTSTVQYGQEATQPEPPHTTTGEIERAAKEAALDSRVEIRTLRRPDLEQVRELHCYHGDGDKVSKSSVCFCSSFSLFFFPFFFLFFNLSFFSSSSSFHIIKTTRFRFPYEISIISSVLPLVGYFRRFANSSCATGCNFYNTNKHTSGGIVKSAFKENKHNSRRGTRSSRTRSRW